MSAEQTIIALTSLLDEADALDWALKALGSSHERTPEVVTQTGQRYQEWYGRALSVLPASFHARFQAAYDDPTSPYPTLREYFADLGENPPVRRIIDTTGGGWRYLASTRRLDQQVTVLETARRQLWPRESRVPEPLRYAFALWCKQCTLPTIRTAFLENDGDPAWWLRPRKTYPSARMTRIMGWFDGLVIFAPQREVAIIRDVWQDMLRRKGLVATDELPAEFLAIVALAQEPAAGPPVAPAAPAVVPLPPDVEDDPTFLREIMLKHRRNLQTLLLQQADHGMDVPLTLINRIAFEREAMERYQQRLQALGELDRPDGDTE